MRIAIFGTTGSVGSALVVHLLKGTALRAGDELILVGRGSSASEARLLAMQADLLDAFDVGIIQISVCIDMAALDGPDVFIMAAGATLSERTPRRADLAAENASLFEESAKQLARCSPNAFVFVVSNPVELAVMSFARHIGRSRVVGIGAHQDSLRFARAIASHLSLHRTDVRASVLGEHGEGMVPLWSSVFLANAEAGHVEALAVLQRAFTQSSNHVSVPAINAQMTEIIVDQGPCEAYSFLRSLAPQTRILIEPLLTTKLLHSTPNATANAMMDLLTALFSADDRHVHGQVLLEGEFYEMHGVLGVPLALRMSGWRIASHEPLFATELSCLQIVNRSINQSLNTFF